MQRGIYTKRKVGWVVKTICIYLLTIPFDFVPIGNYGSLSKIAVLLPAIACLLNMNRLRYKSRVGPAMLALFALCGIFSSLLSPYRAAMSNCFSTLLNISIIFVFAGLDCNDCEMRYLEGTLIYSGILFGIVMVASDYTGVTGRMGISINGAEQNYNYICGYLFLPQAICLQRSNEFLKRSVKIWYVGVFLFMFALTLMTASRGGLLSSLSVLFVFLLVTFVGRTEKTKNKIGLLLGGLCLFSLVYILYVYLVPEELKLRYSLQSISSDNGSNRFLIWESMLQSFSNFDPWHQLVGYGVGTSPYFSYSGGYAAHNAFIAFLLETGIIGLAVYVIMLFKLLKCLRKMKCYGAFSALIGFVVFSCTTTLTNFKPMWIMLFYAIICIDHCRKQSQRNKPLNHGVDLKHE